MYGRRFNFLLLILRKRGRKDRVKQSVKMAYGGILCGLSIVFLFLTGIFPFADYALPALAGMCLIPLVIDFGYRTAVIAYAAIGVLAALIAPNKQSVVLFIAFLGYYPILKGRLETLKSRVLEWAVKLIWFNAAAVLSYYLMVQVLGMSQVMQDFQAFRLGVWGILLIGNVVFVIFDLALTRVISMFIRQIRPKYIRYLSK